jgi:hypothetical protein
MGSAVASAVPAQGAIADRVDLVSLKDLRRNRGVEHQRIEATRTSGVQNLQTSSN